MTNNFANPDLSADDSQRISKVALEKWLHTRAEGDAWDFKEILGDLTNASARVNLAKDALAFCNSPDGGTLVVGVADDYTRVGLGSNERIDTTAIHNAIDAYIDGDFSVLAAVHELTDPGDNQTREYGIIYFRRRSSQPVVAAKQGDDSNGRQHFRSGDIFIRRGAASIRANSEDIRQLLTSTIVHEQRLKAVNEVWSCVIAQRESVSGIEYLHDVFLESEYPGVLAKPEYRQLLGVTTFSEHASAQNALQQRVSQIRPHIPETLFQKYRCYSAVLGRIQMKAIERRVEGKFLSWTKLNDGSSDGFLRQKASELIPEDQVANLWAGQGTTLGRFFPLRPAIDAAESSLCEIIRRVLSGMA